jgi:glycerol-3-phosphate dehydrogenase
VAARTPDLAPHGPSQTGELQLIGADRAKIVCNQNFDKIVVTLRERYNMDREIARHLMHNYGTRALEVAEVAKQKKLCA